MVAPKVKFLAAEALRGVGGVLIDREGKRFANELGRRDNVTGRMWKNKPPFRLCLNSKAAKEIHWHCEHYKGRGVMKYFQTAKDLAMEMDINPATLEQTFNSYNTIAAKQAENPDGGPYDAYGGGKSWDEWGKKFFHNLPLTMDDEFNVAIVTPVIYYCMGGLEIDSNPLLLVRPRGRSWIGRQANILRGRFQLHRHQNEGKGSLQKTSFEIVAVI